MKRKQLFFNFGIEVAIDLHFWALLPAVNINIHSKSFEIEWLCFAVYIDKQERDPFANINDLDIFHNG